MQALPLPQTKQSRWHNSTCGLAKQPRRRSRLGRPEKGCTSLTPCKAQAALPNQASACLVWLASGYQNKRFGWLLAGFWLARTYLAETGWTSPPGGGLVQALPLPQTKQSRWHVWACEAAQASISPWTSQKRLHFLNSLQGCLAKSGLCLPGLAGFWLSKKEVWLASGYQKKRFGWLLAGFWLARTYLAETGWTSPLPGGGLVQALPLPQTKQSRWHVWACEAAQASISPWTSRKRLHFLPARLPCQIRPLLAWFGWLLAIKKRGLVGFWLSKK